LHYQGGIKEESAKPEVWPSSIFVLPHIPVKKVVKYATGDLKNNE
jgi:hypothetical protein